MATLHSSITGADNHEPKGVESALAGTVYRANGSGSGVWDSVSSTDVTFVDPSGTISATNVSDAILELSDIVPSGSGVPLSTDGRSLYRFRRKVGLIKAAVPNSKLRVAVTGDSWATLLPIPDAIIDTLSAGVATSATSFVAANATNHWTGTTLVPSGGWTFQDGSVAGTVFTYGVGADGHVYHTTGATETITCTNVPGTGYKIFTRNHSGTWRYRTDGGAWTVVSDGAGGALKVTTVSGLADSNHLIEIDTTGNTGRVVFCGIQNTRSQSVEVLKLGNGGMTGDRMGEYIQSTADMWTSLDPDLVIVFMGTNDYRISGETPEAYLGGIQAVTSMFNGISPEIGVIFVVPSQSNGTIVYPLSGYRDVLYQHTISTGTEMENLLDSWGPYQSDIWTDTLHVNDAGAAIIGLQLDKHLLGL